MANKTSAKKKKNTNKNHANDPYRNIRFEETDTKKSHVGKDIAFIVLVAFFILIVVSFFTEPLHWLKDAGFFVFGYLIYPAPVFLFLFFLLIFYYTMDAKILRRILSSVLILFAVSGILSFVLSDVKDGGLLGRLNFLAFNSWLGTVGGVIVNILLVIIALIIFLDFSLVTYLHEKREEKKEENQIVREQRREEKELLKKQKELKTKEDHLKDLETARAKNKAWDEYNAERDQSRKETEERLKKQYRGIGDTTIGGEDGSEDGDVNDMFRSHTVFVTPEDNESDTENENFESEDTDSFDDTPSDEVDKEVKTYKESDTKEEYNKVVITKNEKPGAIKEYHFPPMNRLAKGSNMSSSEKNDQQKDIQHTAEKLTQTLRTFGIGVTVTNVSVGPSATRYELQPELGVKISKIVSLQDDIKMALAASDIRIEAPIPGKSAIGIEVPNRVKQGIVLRDLLESSVFRSQKSKLSFPLGRDIDGNVICCDIEKMPHILIAGTTGSGKSVCINTLLITLLYHAKPSEVRLILIDPKVVELSRYNGIPHLMLPVVTNPKRAAMALSWATAEMDRRYEVFARYEVRDIGSFNEFIDMENPEDEDGNPVKKMQQIVIVVDEFADLMMVASKDVEEVVCRLAQKARAAGIHLVLATQSPRADVITGLIKANMPSRIALTVSSSLESRIILDMNGAERLLGRGDMLYAPIGTGKPIRVQGAFVSDNEIHDVLDFVQKEGNVLGGGTDSSIDLTVPVGNSGKGIGGDGDTNVSGFDEMFGPAGHFCIENQKGTCGMLQRKFGVGFNRAARILDQLAEHNVVSQGEGTKPRKVLMSKEEFDKLLDELKLKKE